TYRTARLSISCRRSRRPRCPTTAMRFSSSRPVGPSGGRGKSSRAPQGGGVRKAGERHQGARLGGGPGYVSDPAEAAHDGVPARGGASAAAHQRDCGGDESATHAGAGDPSVLRRERLSLGQYADHHRPPTGGGGGL